MTSEIKKAGRKAGAWGVVRKHLATWEKPGLLALVKGLFEATAENRDFIEARCFLAERGRRRSGAGRRA